eukprot:gene5961-biopygen5092
MPRCTAVQGAQQPEACSGGSAELSTLVNMHCMGSSATGCGCTAPAPMWGRDWQLRVDGMYVRTSMGSRADRILLHAKWKMASRTCTQWSHLDGKNSERDGIGGNRPAGAYQEGPCVHKEVFHWVGKDGSDPNRGHELVVNLQG